MEASAAFGLRTWIAAHRVAWEEAPAVEWTRGARTRSGWWVTLYARVPPGDRGPGCAACADAQRGLELVAADLAGGAPAGESRVEARPAWYYRREGGGRPEVAITLWMPSRAATERFGRRLARLGAREGGWLA